MPGVARYIQKYIGQCKKAKIGPEGTPPAEKRLPIRLKPESAPCLDIHRQEHFLSSGLQCWLDYEGPENPESQLYDLAYPGPPSSVRKHPSLTFPPVGRDVKMITNGLVLVSPSLHQRTAYLLPPHRLHYPGRYRRYGGPFGEADAGAMFR